ncbi:hypothetical protein Bca52824_017618 [Brassica carinata]|uniref:Uncharacterized protein n=1 Tax=Brassica carinata TaxID=52824 RepID=A0A8X7VNF2_BRACI|nr:hypothetical protein Bca52824_017618 [Brassica carinata]
MRFCFDIRQEVSSTGIDHGFGAHQSASPLLNKNADEAHNGKSPRLETRSVERPEHADNPGDQSFPEVEDPTFSLGVTQEGSTDTVMIACPLGYVIPLEDARAEANEGWKSKRNRVTPAGLQDFQWDPKIWVPYSVSPDIDRVFE